MDIDDVQQQETTGEGSDAAAAAAAAATASTKKAAPTGLRYELKEDDPFDLEAYVAPYTGEGECTFLSASSGTAR